MSTQCYLSEVSTSFCIIPTIQPVPKLCPMKTSLWYKIPASIFSGTKPQLCYCHKSIRKGEEGHQMFQTSASRILLPLCHTDLSLSIFQDFPYTDLYIHNLFQDFIVLQLEEECVTLPCWCWNWWHILGPWNVEEVRMC